MSLNIELKDAKTAWRPGEEVEGDACWNYETPPPYLLLKLGWRCQGDFVTAVEERVENPAAGHAHHAFHLKAPAGPWTFEGKLFQVRWCVRLEDPEGGSGEAEVSIR
ncbi:MAG TPA: hypothetical protein VF950_18765 [Planctomycetota bacterium]